MSIVLVTILFLYATVVPVSAGTDNGTILTTRLAGKDPYQTSVLIAGAYNNNGNNVILASGNSFPDALSASMLSQKLNAPIMLVNSTANDSSEAFNYIKTHVFYNSTVYIIGGTGVIGTGFETELFSMGYDNIKRLGGINRYDTNMLIVNDGNVPQGTPVFISSGENFPDALSIASFSGSRQYPTLLVGADYLPEQTKNYLISDKPSTVYITGGTSVVSQDLESQIKVLVPGATITRLAGDDRYGTNAAVLNEFSPTPATIYLASGDDFQDVLAGSALAAKTGDPIILVDNKLSTLPLAVEDYLKTLSGSGIRPNIMALGDTDVVSDELMQQVNNVFSDVTNTSTSQGATDTDNSILIEKQQKAGPFRIALGNETAYYLDSTGHVWAWGLGESGQLGNGTTGIQVSSSDTVNQTCESTVPVKVSNLSNIVSIVAGVDTCYALDCYGKVWTWGYGNDGQLGNGTKGNQLIIGYLEYPTCVSSTPVQVSNLIDIVSIAAGQYAGYALDSSGHVWAWGSGWGSPDGSLNSSVPIQVSNLNDIVSISANDKGSEAFAIDSSGQVWAWGSFGSGDSTMPTTNDPTQATVPVQLSNLKNIIAIAYQGRGEKGYAHPIGKDVWGGPSNDQVWYALDSSGQVWSWEFIGWYAKDGIKTPLTAAGLTNIVAIVGRGEDYSLDIFNSGYALDKSGHVWAWGDGINGELGNGIFTKYQSTPVQVSNISNISEIVGNDKSCYALDSSGQVWAWGLNGSGQLGNGTITDSNVPVQVMGLPN